MKGDIIMFKLSAHFVGGTSGFCGKADTLHEIVSDAIDLAEISQIAWIQIKDETTGSIIYELGERY